MTASLFLLYVMGMNLLTSNAPPVPNTSTTFVWEGYARGDEILPGDVHVPSGEIVDKVTVSEDGLRTTIVNKDGDSFELFVDDTLYIERTVVVIISEA